VKEKTNPSADLVAQARCSCARSELAEATSRLGLARGEKDRALSGPTAVQGLASQGPRIRKRGPRHSWAQEQLLREPLGHGDALPAHVVQPLGDVDAAGCQGRRRHRPFEVGLQRMRIETVGANPEGEAGKRDLSDRIEL
jgi:hypothetical protein